MVQLGGNIELTGFDNIRISDQIVLKKIIGSFVKQISTQHQQFQKCSIVFLNPAKEASEQYHLKIQLMLDKEYNAEMQDNNMYFALDKACKAVAGQIQ
ncbi:hypothetical protein HZA96_01050 [Candidatus Woesearchaeota archaeon]|nr:hypothetical protein [Candidatus Woesearchaeota archaeon]